jgi:hypothetical protein
MNREISSRLGLFTLFVSLWCIAPSLQAQENPVEVSSCNLAKDPKNFDGKLIRVRAGLNVFFEDFTLEIMNCDSDQGIWLAFGGDVPGIVASTVNDEFRRSGSVVRVNGVSYGIKKDDEFHKLYALIASRHGDKPDYRVTATLTGTFLAGREGKTAQGSVYYAGYGHLGCCALLVITQVSDVESDPPADLHLHGVVRGPDGEVVEGLAVIDDVLGGSPPERQTSVTDKLGEFTFSNSGQQLRIESPKYRPIALTVTPGGASIRVELQDAKDSDWVLPACGNARSQSRVGFSVLFAIPHTMKSSPVNSDDMHSFFVYLRGRELTSAELIMSHSRDEIKDLPNSLDSKWFEERWAKDGAGNVIGIDASGEMDRGGFWRTVVFSGHDTAGYRFQSGKKPIALDQIIDSACFSKVSAH